MMARKIVLVLLLVAVCAGMSACGRKNKPLAPEDVDPKYPRTYPAPVPAPAPTIK